MKGPFSSESLSLCAAEPSVLTLPILLPPWRPGLQVVTGQLAHTVLSFSIPTNLQPFFPSGFHKQSLKIGASGKTSPPSVSKKVPSQHVPVACAIAMVSSPSQEERTLASRAGLGSLLYLWVTEQMSSFPRKTGWARASTCTHVGSSIQLLPRVCCSRGASFHVGHA